MSPELLLQALLSCLAAGLVTGLTVPLVSRWARVVHAMDLPGGRKTHGAPVPRLGGLAIAAGIVSGIAVSSAPISRTWASELSIAGSVVVATLIILGLGLADDIVGLSILQKFLGQLAAAVLVVSIGWSFHVLRLPFIGEVELGWFGPLLSVVWIVGVTNAINLLDGLDGLAGGLVGIIACSLALYAVLQGNAGTVIATSAVVGSCLAFLRFNWFPAKIFMGDSGSLTLGFILAVLTVQSSLKASAAVAILVPVLALGLPVMDTLLVMARRFYRSHSKTLFGRAERMFAADRSHLHHLLVRGARSRRAVMTIYGLVAAFCLLALIVALSGNPMLGTGLVAIEFVVVLVVRQIGQRRALAPGPPQPARADEAERLAAQG